MKLSTLRKECAMALFVAGMFAMGPVLADKGDKGDKDDRKQQKHDRKENKKSHKGKDDHADGDRRHFQPQQHVVVREYYAESYRGRSCPPGLAKKNNGCMPPGQAKKWRVGSPLPREVIYYSVPAPLVVQIGPPPSGHRYVRVAGDILMIAIGTGMVVDAIADLGSM